MIKIPSEVKTGAAASGADLDVVVQTLGPLPPAHRALLVISDGLEAPSGVVLYPTADLIERHESYEAETYAPGWVVIGDDGQGRVVLLDRGGGSVVLADAGVMDPASATPIAQALEVWVAAGMPLPSDVEVEAPARVDVFLERRPSGGAKDLLVIRRELVLQTGLSELRLAVANTPARLLRDVPFGKYVVRCRRVNAISSCLGLRAVDKPDERIAIPDA